MRMKTLSAHVRARQWRLYGTDTASQAIVSPRLQRQGLVAHFVMFLHSLMLCLIYAGRRCGGRSSSSAVNNRRGHQYDTYWAHG
jgi:hypothetical protein